MLTLIIAVWQYLTFLRAVQLFKLHPDMKMKYDVSLGCIVLVTIPIDAWLIYQLIHHI